MSVNTVMPAALIERPYKVLTHGLMIMRSLSFEEWRACGVALTEIANRTTWAIGDWLVYGAGRGDYGTYYQEAATITGRSLESLSQAARVSQAYPIEQRTIAVSWSFYREALRLPDGERLRSLDIAQKNTWTRDGLADYISTREVAEPSMAKRLSDGTTVNRTQKVRARWHQRPRQHHRILQCPSCGFKFEPKRRQRLTVVQQEDVQRTEIVAAGSHSPRGVRDDPAR